MHVVLPCANLQSRLAHGGREATGAVHGRVTRRPVARLDPILRRADLDDEKKRIWIEDQYHHPLEHVLALPRVVRVLDELGFEWVRTVPPLAAAEGLFEASPRPASLIGLRLGFLLRGCSDPDAGLVCYLARRTQSVAGS